MNLLDKAIEQYQGVWPTFDWESHERNKNALVLVVRLDPNWNLDKVSVGDITLGGTAAEPYYAEVICTKEEFEKRARELGWINGYKWGKLYDTKGAVPTLPEDCIVELIFNNDTVDKCWHEHVNWARVVSFRIVDSRFKPRTTSWRPTAGSWCQVAVGNSTEYSDCFFVGYSSDGKLVMEAPSGKCNKYSVGTLSFLPIKSPKEKAVEKALEALSSVWNDPKDELVHVLETLFSAGLLK